MAAAALLALSVALGQLPAPQLVRPGETVTLRADLAYIRNGVLHAQETTINALKPADTVEAAVPASTAGGAPAAQEGAAVLGVEVTDPGEAGDAAAAVGTDVQQPREPSPVPADALGDAGDNPAAKVPQPADVALVAGTGAMPFSLKFFKRAVDLLVSLVIGLLVLPIIPRR